MAILYSAYWTHVGWEGKRILGTTTPLRRALYTTRTMEHKPQKRIPKSKCAWQGWMKAAMYLVHCC
jgi:hypothetical protein